jgi:elongation factor G
MNNGLPAPWVIEAAIEAQSATDTQRLASALAQLASEDPTFGYAHDGASPAFIVMATDESTLDAHLAALRRAHGSDLRAGTPQIRYREALARAVDVDYTHKKVTGGSGEFACVRLRIEPGEPGAGTAFRSEVVGGVVPDRYIGGVEQGVRRVCDTGLLAGFPIDAIAALYDGAFHEIDSSWTAFEIAGRSAMREGASQAGVKLLEPIMDVAVWVPPELAGVVITDMYKRGVRVEDGDSLLDAIANGGLKVGEAILIVADAPLARLLGYAEVLRAISGGRASCTVSFGRYAEVQRNDGPDDFAPTIGMRA